MPCWSSDIARYPPAVFALRMHRHNATGRYHCHGFAANLGQFRRANNLQQARLSTEGSDHGSDQRQEDQDDSQRRHVPYEGAQQKNPCCV